jgi:glycosyltransferase involved in cell wall biosynthesis
MTPGTDTGFSRRSRNSSMRILMLASNTCVSDARVIKEAEALAEKGHAVCILAHWKPETPGREIRNGVEYRRHALTRRLQRAMSKPMYERAMGEKRASGTLALAINQARRAAACAKNLLVNISSGTGALLLRHARAYTDAGTRWAPDVVHAHDLPTLLAGVRIARRTGARLIYDSHELEIGRNGNYSRWEKFIRAISERALIGQTSSVITVCDSIADFLAGHYGIARPIVVHNAPIAPRVVHDERDHVRSRLGLSADVPVAVYVGSVTINRGVEQSIEALAELPDLHLACVGPRNAGTEQRARTLAAELGVSARLHFIDPVPHDRVTSFIRSADVSLVLVQNVCLSYRFCFPNKLLESLLAGVPVVAARLDELTRMVKRTGGGLIVDETSPASIAAGIAEVVRNREAFAPGAHSIEWLRSHFGWEHQSRKLLDLYERLSTPAPKPQGLEEAASYLEITHAPQ